MFAWMVFGFAFAMKTSLGVLPVVVRHGETCFSQLFKVGLAGWILTYFLLNDHCKRVLATNRHIPSTVSKHRYDDGNGLWTCNCKA